LELGGPLGPSALGSLPTLPKVKASPVVNSNSVNTFKSLLDINLIDLRFIFA